MQSFSFMTSPTWKLSKVFKTFGSIKYKVTLILERNSFLLVSFYFIQETRQISVNQELLLSKKLNLLQNKKV